MFTGEDLLVVYSKIWENPVLLPLVVGLVIIPILIIILILRVIFVYYMNYKAGKFFSSIKYVLLAIDIPKNNEQNLAAVEQLYVNLTAIKFSPNWIQKYFNGVRPLSISMELISIDGYIQFLIRCTDRAVDLVSSSIYSQYPEAEIVRVEDYTEMIPANIGDSDCPYQLWGTEFVLEKPSAYPLKTYKMFEHSLTDSFNDPLTPLLEAYSRLGVGENAALQIILTPLGDAWKKSAADEIKKLFGAVIVNETTLDKYLKGLFNIINSAAATVLSTFGFSTTGLVKVEPKMKSMAEMTPGERLVIEKMQEKLAKPSFSTTIRYVYLAKREVYNRNRGVDSVKGAMSQFGQSDLNSFTMHGMGRTDVDYYFVEQRVRPRIKRMAKSYKARSRGGAQEFFLSTEELATIFHFPAIEVKTPMLPKSMIKKTQPPSILPTILEDNYAPVSESAGTVTEVKQANDNGVVIKKEEIYNIINSLPGYDFNNKYYEHKFELEDEPAEVINKFDKKEEKFVKEKYEAPDNLPFIQD